MASTVDEALPMTDSSDFAFQHSSPLSLRHPSTFSSPPAPPLSNPYDDETTSDELHDTSERVIRPSESITHHHALSSADRRLSGHSSISSFPASVLHHDQQRTPSRLSHHERHDSFGKAVSPRRHKGLSTAFRNPSSVMEMQLNDDTGDETESVVSHHVRSGSRMSVRSHGSSHSSPSKRGTRSVGSSPKKGSGLRKEFPLVLLHCTLLPPANNWVSPTCPKELFAALLPDGYRQRWIQLHDKLSSAEVKLRGILLPHPQDDYELLEERLLEALELESPRIQGSHFDDKGADSGFEDGSQSESDADDKCPDCGKQIGKRERKWEIKVFAANGLMRGAAWTAAWRDMEKVDVQVDVFMPEDVRREVNTRLEALQAAEEEAQMEEEAASTTAAQHEPRGSAHELPRERTRPDEPYQQRAQPQAHDSSARSPRASSAIELLLQDRKNIVILLLSIVVAVYAIILPRIGQFNEPSSVLASHTGAQAVSPVANTATWSTTGILQEVPPIPVATANHRLSMHEPANRPSGPATKPAEVLNTETIGKHIPIDEAAPLAAASDNTDNTRASPIVNLAPDSRDNEHEIGHEMQPPDAVAELQRELSNKEEQVFITQDGEDRRER
ncbi:uncharacterized protein AB675_3814 [Cyphellophora attinorum]|uniref:Uncharacterized protein n=1 Tax=Cyphellophora attinorum TaxID=1664694 RepID=A0A0N1H1T4_9EURO|nr:uncharacterized protein AB675_3814 [Phialophora attinorum]KPI34910.1 hypothetical protein AB675_3814 [Phialophora attinorum]